ncbi:MAG TPA: glycosyltransferase family 2 protein [Gammaproteobacteria bacterium]|nr:glycosyltransferase family 2 protein [Gammaproteobacteria bacterium]
MTSKQLSIIVPVYKEEKNIQPFLQRIEIILNKMNLNYEILFCLDPSPDQTQNIIQQEIIRNSNIKLILFSRRFGQPAATMAGISLCKGESCVVMDVDLQDPPELIEPLYQKLSEGYEVVYAKRRSRQGETWLKRFIAHLGYQAINKLSDVQLPKDTGDFRIMKRRVIEELCRLNETHGFLRGLVAYIGFKQTFIEYDRDKRFMGKSNYNRFIGSLKIGLNGLISFGSRPLQMMSVIGGIIATFSFLLGGWYVLQKLIGMSLTPGLSTTVLVVTFFSGVQLLCLGLMGEYVGRIYDEVKRRPMFIIDKIIENNSEEYRV